MTTFLAVVLAYLIGFWWGKRVGIAYAMTRMQDIIEEMQQIDAFFKGKKQQWNEDNL